MAPRVHSTVVEVAGTPSPPVDPDEFCAAIEADDWVVDWVTMQPNWAATDAADASEGAADAPPEAAPDPELWAVDVAVDADDAEGVADDEPAELHAVTAARTNAPPAARCFTFRERIEPTFVSLS